MYKSVFIEKSYFKEDLTITIEIDEEDEEGFVDLSFSYITKKYDGDSKIMGSRIPVPHLDEVIDMLSMVRSRISSKN